jgi:hypothetical protein
MKEGKVSKTKTKNVPIVRKSSSIKIYNDKSPATSAKRKSKRYMSVRTANITAAGIAPIVWTT